MNVRRGCSYSAIVTFSLFGKYVYPSKVGESTFLFKVSGFPKIAAFKGSQACPAVLCYEQHADDDEVWSIGGMILTGED